MTSSNSIGNSDADSERTVCFCHYVSQGELLQAIHAGAHTLADIQSETRASTGCGGCECEVLDILEAELEKLAREKAGT